MKNCFKDWSQSILLLVLIVLSENIDNISKEVSTSMAYLRVPINAYMCYNSVPLVRPGAKYIEKYSNTLYITFQLLSLINDYNYRTSRIVMIIITLEM